VSEEQSLFRITRLGIINLGKFENFLHCGDRVRTEFPRIVKWYYIIYFHSVDPYRITKSIWIWK